MPVIYPSSNYNELMRNNTPYQDNIALHREVNLNTYEDGEPILDQPTSTLENMCDVDNQTGMLYDLMTEIGWIYGDSYDGLGIIGANENDTGVRGGVPMNGVQGSVPVFTDLKAIKLRHIQRDARRMSFEMRRLIAECNRIKMLDESELPLSTSPYPSSINSPGDLSTF